MTSSTSALYDALGVPNDADTATIKGAYRKAVQTHHPDRGGDRTEFERVQGAYDVLSDPDKRRRYDETGDAGNDPDNSAAMMVTVLASAFDRATAIFTMDPAAMMTFDVTKTMREIISEDIRKAEQDLETIAKAAKQVETVRKRLSYKGGGSNILDGVLKSRAQQCQKARQSTAAKLEVLRRAEVEAQAYSYKTDQPAGNGYRGSGFLAAAMDGLNDQMRKSMEDAVRKAAEDVVWGKGNRSGNR